MHEAALNDRRGLLFEVDVLLKDAVQRRLLREALPQVPVRRGHGEQILDLLFQCICADGVNGREKPDEDARCLQEIEPVSAEPPLNCHPRIIPHSGVFD